MTTQETDRIVEVNVEDVVSALTEAEQKLSPKSYEVLKNVTESYAQVFHLLEDRQTTIHRLRNLIFGPTSEKMEKVLEALGEVPSAASEAEAAKDSQELLPRKRRKGHGRNGASAYVGAEKIPVPHPTLHVGDHCPTCKKGRLYRLKDANIVRFKGQAPLMALDYQLERLRCNLCSDIFKADAPEGIGEEKYDPSAGSMIAILRYGGGFPHNRLEQLQKNLKMVVPASTQWEIVLAVARKIAPAHQELIRQAAQCEVVYNDDTGARILEFLKKLRGQEKAQTQDGERKGIFTTGIVAKLGPWTIALFFTGHKYAGENLADVLRQRDPELPAPIQMCDGLLSRNVAKDCKVVLGGCNSHARRKYVDVARAFPNECRFVLQSLAKVYRVDAEAKAQALSPQARLELHQAKSLPVMDGLHQWMKEQIDGRKVEKNSGLGKAIGYMEEHWEKLTLFLNVPGAPLDNNLCELILKKAIIHRKNSLFYKTMNGAWVGDLFMSLIRSTDLNAGNAFDYLNQLQIHAEELKKNPADWMPWNYKATLARTAKPP